MAASTGAVGTRTVRQTNEGTAAEAMTVDIAREAPPVGTDGGAPEYVRALDRGLAVIKAFSREHPDLTLAEVARAVGLAPATARRFLHTLHALGYVSTDGRTWALRPRVLELGQAYLASTTTWDAVQARLAALAHRVGESSSAGVLDHGDVLYTVRVPVRRIMSMTIEIGTRIPAFASSMGRVLLAALPDAELDEFLDHLRPYPVTARTVQDKGELRALLLEVREQGYCLLEQELEMGVQCVAAPIRDKHGAVFAAITVSSHTSRVTPAALRGELLPEVLATAQGIDEDLRLRG